MGFSFIECHRIIERLGRDIFHKIRLLRASYSLALSTSRDRVSTTTLGNIFHYLTILREKNFLWEKRHILDKEVDNSSFTTASSLVSDFILLSLLFWVFFLTSLHSSPYIFTLIISFHCYILDLALSFPHFSAFQVFFENAQIV